MSPGYRRIYRNSPAASIRRSCPRVDWARRSTCWPAVRQYRSTSLVAIERRLPDPVEVAAYCVVAEALTNAAKHAQASMVEVCVDTEGRTCTCRFEDDGIGGADAAKGSGMTGLRDRVEALGGTLSISSHPGTGTALRATIPFEDS